jgi:hypothetical protein
MILDIQITLNFIALIYLTFLYFIHFINNYLLTFYLLSVSMDPHTPNYHVIIHFNICQRRLIYLST